MPRRRIRDRPPSLALSFVDTVSGGFGAAFFLFLIFASLPIDGATGRSGGGQRFLEIWMFWPDNAGVAELYLARNDDRPVRFTSSLMEEDAATGRLKVESRAHPFWKQGFASGFSWFGEAQMSAATAPANGAARMRATRFRLGNHCGGDLRVFASVFGRRSAADWLTGGPLPPVPIEIELIVSSGFGAKEVYKGSADATSNGVATPVELTRDAKSEFSISLPEAKDEQPWCQPS